MIYLDYAATTPMSEEAIEVYTRVSRSVFGNPSSLHDAGSHAFHLLEHCREELAELLHAHKTGIYFTGGGSESNILALQSLIEASTIDKGHLITTKVEHPSILNFFARLEGHGYDVTYLSVDKEGLIDLQELSAAIQDNTILASIHHGNGEIGTLQKMEEIGDILHSRNILFHSDCVQTFCKVPMNVNLLPVDSLSFSSHKVYGPKGVGAVYISPETPWQPYLPNTTHEKGFRSGTVNVPGIAAFVTAAQNLHQEMTEEQTRLSAIRHLFIKELASLPYQIKIEGAVHQKLAHILGMRAEGVQGQYLMLGCNRHGIAISTGSACSTGQQSPSKTMTAIGRSETEARQFVRLSFGKSTTADHVYQTVKTLNALLEEFFDTK
ncbi:IscS subfamily cysteine desulfurase [Sediminibacillus albus]|uniref:Cysteine desulfurase n=1 Tax=Sediminibacillus albus TaxID=407036 RepID=A0A1G9D8I4_9BACI|nr:IscS subfamily cysteine desulfurase [Sediminibacillus albus]SDK60202.1 cysteine desulfurase [Sediminibacillus albus]